MRTDGFGFRGMIENILERPAIYRASQAPFAEPKFAPLLDRNDLGRARRVLDVACGSGTNTAHFADGGCVGIDIHEIYIRDARRKYGRDFIARGFIAVDARELEHVRKGTFDVILVNSFLHHLSNGDVPDIFSSLDSRLSPDGHIHILELVLPESRSFARLLANWGRGYFARPFSEWHTLFFKIFTPVLFEPYYISAKRVVLWNMVYFKRKSERKAGRHGFR
jgi:2-polyprenyl-3-methyl-5-hydroxy-6-metoxy-1,4-benzoquinol methylase